MPRTYPAVPPPRLIRLIANREGSYQPPAPRNRTGYLLRRPRGDYLVRNRETNETFRPDGAYIFVILFDTPKVVLVMPHSDTSQPDAYGHASMTQPSFDPEVRPINYDPRPVCYAGQIVFRHGVLRYWNNGSGHYQPAQYLRHCNLSPAAALLLPDFKFEPYRKHEAC